jgi:hypothetical protein
MEKAHIIRNWGNADLNKGNTKPLNNKYCVGKEGIDKNLTFSEVCELAFEVKANIIVKGGPNAKWYLKKIDKNKIQQGIIKCRPSIKNQIMWEVEWF